MNRVIRRTKASCVGNSGIPEEELDPEEEVDVPVVCAVVGLVELLDDVDDVATVVEAVEDVEVDDEGVITETEFEL